MSVTWRAANLGQYAPADGDQAAGLYLEDQWFNIPAEWVPVLDYLRQVPPMDDFLAFLDGDGVPDRETLEKQMFTMTGIPQGAVYGQDPELDAIVDETLLDLRAGALTDWSAASEGEGDARTATVTIAGRSVTVSNYAFLVCLLSRDNQVPLMAVVGYLADELEVEPSVVVTALLEHLPALLAAEVFYLDLPL